MNEQHGFQSGKSTDTAIFNFIDTDLCLLDPSPVKQEIVYRFFFDRSKGFDSEAHTSYVKSLKIMVFEVL